MQNLNAWMIQDALKQVKRIDIPWLQYTFGLPYSTAKWMMEQLEMRGWAVRSADRRYWRVQTKKLCLRRLEPSECPVLSEKLTLDCLSALECLQQADGAPVTYSKLEDAVRGAHDTAEALRILLALRLVFEHKQLYFSCISSKEIGSLTAIARKLIRMRVVDRYSPEEAVRRMREALFKESVNQEPQPSAEEDEGDDW